MSLLNSIQEVAKTIMANPLCGRLAEVSLELVIVAVAVWAFIRFFRIRSARVCSLLWVLVLAKAALGLVVGTPFNVADVPLAPPVQVNALSTNTPFDLSEGARLQREMETRRALREADAMMSSAMAAGTKSTVGASEVLAAPQPGSAAAKQWTASSIGLLVSRGLMALWALGVLWLVGRTLLDLLKIRRLNGNSAAPPEAVFAVFNEEAKRLGIKRGPRLGVCDEIESPALIGFFNASVLVPQWLAESTSKERVRWMLAHELTHWKHKDPAGLFVRRMAQVLLWFHPVVWWAGTRWEEAAEYACDRALVENKAQAHDYAEQLYRVLENMSERRLQLSRQTGMFATRTQIGRRIATLLANPLRSSARLSTFSVITLCALAVVALSCGVGVAWKSPEKGKTNASLELSDEELLKIYRLNVDFRSVETAIAAYMIDQNKKPPNLVALTTPIAYIHRVPRDPFGEGPLMADFYPAYAPDMVQLGSVGPDGKWDNGTPIKSDETGLKGDYVRLINPSTGQPIDSPEGIWNPLKTEAQKERVPRIRKRMAEEKEALWADMLGKISKGDWAKFADVNADFRTMGTALSSYQHEYGYGKVPAKLSALTTPIGFIMKIPNDPFGRGPIRVNLSPSSAPGMVMLGSVGPDGKWDNFRSMDIDTSGLKGDYIRVINPNTGGFADVNGANWDPIKAEVQKRQIARDNKWKTDYIKEWGAKSVGTRVARVQSDLRSIQTGMDAYMVDNNTYPLVFRSLTTPIAYVQNVPLDPFSKEEIPDTYKMNLNAPEYKPIIYSVGPDGVDQKGKEVYDPAKGDESPGDIVRKMNGAIVRIEDEKLKARISQQKMFLDLYRTAIGNWYYGTRKGLPKSWQQIVDDGDLGGVPEDEFVPGRSLHYRLAPDGKTARLYSFGPDGDDDKGEKEIVGIVSKGTIPDGDVIIEISLEELRKTYVDIPVFDPAGPLDRSIIDKLPERDKHMKLYLEYLFDMQEKEGRPNAMLYYVVANILTPPISNPGNLVEGVLRDGWTKESEVLRPYIQSWQPAFKHIRKGVALDYAKNVSVTHAASMSVPDFLNTQTSAKALCVEGRWFESQGKYRDALENYLATLTLGRDYTSEGGMLISHLIGIAIASIADARILDLVASGNLEKADLERCRTRLAEIEGTFGTTAMAFRGERKLSEASFAKAQEMIDVLRNTSIEDLAKEKNVPPEKMEEFKQQVEMMNQGGDAKEDGDKMWNLLFKEIEKPYEKRNRDEFQKEMNAIMENAHPFAKIAMPNFYEADIRSLISLTKLRQARLAPALEVYKMDKKRYPESMGTLMPRYLDSLIIDPFSGKSILYEPSGDGYKMWSVGPDSKDDSGTIRYDPSNGTVSRGDILFSK